MLWFPHQWNKANNSYLLFKIREENIHQKTWPAVVYIMLSDPVEDTTLGEKSLVIMNSLKCPSSAYRRSVHADLVSQLR